MLIPVEKINEAKALYKDEAIQEIIAYFGTENTYNEKTRSCSCPWHIDKTPSFIWNDKDNCFHCFSCSRNYGILDLYMDKGMTYIEAVQELFKNVGMEYDFSKKYINNNHPSFKYPQHIKEDRKKVEDYMSLRKISTKTLDYADVQSDEHGNVVFHYYDSNDILTSVKYRLGRKHTNEDNLNHIPKCWYQKGADNAPILYNMNRIDPTKPLVITEGETDALSVIEAGYKNVVSIPGGCQNMQWIEYNWDWLEQFDKIIVWYDSDEPGIKARTDVCYRLGTWRTYYIEINETIDNHQIKDANELLYYKGSLAVLRHIEKPFEIPVEKVIDLATAEDFDIEKAEGLYTGIKELDDKIYKLVFGTVVVITGKSGEGKSVLANQIAICQPLQQGYDVFVFSGELPAPILRSWVETNMIGREFITMKDNHIRVFDKTAKNAMNTWYSGRVLVYDDNYDTSAKALLNKMEELARKCGTKVFLIDNLMMVDLECSEEGRNQAEKSFVQDLLMFAKKYNVLVFLVAHPRKIGNELRVTKEDIAGSSNIVNLAHMVFSVHRYTDKEKQGETNLKGEYLKGKEPKEYDTVVDVLKNRITGQLPSVDLYFDYNSYRFYREPNELWFRYGWDKRNPKDFPIPKTDPNIHKVIPKEQNEEESPL